VGETAKEASTNQPSAVSRQPSAKPNYRKGREERKEKRKFNPLNFRCALYFRAVNFWLNAVC